MLTIGSLFSGIGGLELGLEWAGLGPVLWQVEKDPYCLKVLEKHWPDVERYDDVCKIDGTIKPVDLICGGFPCQDISCAGRGAGIKDGTRSGLWFEFARIISELRPKFVIVENVPALLTRGMDVVLGQLATLRYDAWWDCISAQSVGAPHKRDRTFIIAYTMCNGLSRVIRKNRKVSIKRDHTTQWEAEPRICRVDDGSRNRVDRIRALGNAVVPQVAQVIGEIVKELAHAP